VNTSLQHCSSCTGCLCGNISSTSWRVSPSVPDYFAGDCQLVADSGRRSLRSAERCVCSVPRQIITFGDRSFVAASPRAWNELPFSLRDTGLSLTTFNAHLKTYSPLHLRQRFICVIYDLFAPHINVLTYLLTYLLAVICGCRCICGLFALLVMSVSMSIVNLYSA